MSRRSLRLPNSDRYGAAEGFLERGSPLQSYSSSPLAKGASGGHRALKSRLSVSCSQSLLQQTPPPASSLRQHYGSQSLHSAADSDASLLASMMEESALEEKTMMDSFWGLDQDGDPTESTLLANPSFNSTVLSACNDTVLCPKHPGQTQTSIIDGHHYCSDCVIRSDRKEALATTAAHGGGQAHRPTTTIYGRDKIRKNRKVSVGHTGVSVIKRWWAGLFKVLALFYTNVLLKIRHDGAELSQYCGVVNVKGMMGTNGKRLDCNGSLCTCVSGLARAAGSAASADWALSKNLLSWVWSTGQSSGKAWHHLVTLTAFLTTRRSLAKLLPLLLVVTPLLLCGLWCLCGSEALLSVLPAVNVTQWGTVLSSSLWSSSPPDSLVHETDSDVQASAETLPHLPPPTTAHSQEGEDSDATASPPSWGDSSGRLEQTSGDGDSSGRLEQTWGDGDSSGRLLRLEQSVSQLWHRAEAGGRREERRHGDVVALFQELQRQVLQEETHSSRPHALEPWVSGLLDHRLDGLRRQLEEEGQSREQTQQQYVLQQEKQASHLAELELLINSLTVKTEEFQRRQEEAIATTVALSPSMLPVPVSVSVDRDSHDALLAEVDGLKSTLEDVRQDLQGLQGFQERCEQQEDLQETISARVKAQVREELRVLFYGNQLAARREEEEEEAPEASTEGPQSQALPRDSLLQWLAERYVTPKDLRAGLDTLELSVLDAVSLKMEETQQVERRGTTGEARPETQGRDSELSSTSVTEEEVRLMVKHAIRLYSEDQTSMPDFALESGGGSILSTRCSETHETKTALLSLFGVSLWYFTQSPRVVIQPDIQPGNCWAFKGSQGYLVIRLSMRVIPTAFSLEHMPRALAPSGRLNSAPKDFTVQGLDDENQVNGTFLGRYTYEEDGDALQTFTVTEQQEERSFQMVEVQVLSNWGHQEYTCMYRFRVHGRPSSN